MKDIENLVKQFLYEEDFSLRNALAYAGMGLSKVTGSVAEIVNGIGFADQQYSPERQTRMAELLGEMMFYWYVLAGTVGISPDEICAQYVAAYEATKVKLAQEQGITVQDLMNMKKHVKTGAILKYSEAERELDWEEKKKYRQDIL